MTLGEGVLKMSGGSLVVLKGIRCNNMCYLMGSAVTRMVSSEQLMTILPDYGIEGSNKLA